VNYLQGRIQEFAKGGGRRYPYYSLPFLSPFPPPVSFFRLEVGPLNQLWVLGERCKLLQRGPGLVPGRKRICTVNSCQPRVAIILNNLSTMFYVFEEINCRWCRHNRVPLSHIMSTVSDGVSPSPKGGRSRLDPLSSPPLI